MSTRLILVPLLLSLAACEPAADARTAPAGADSSAGASATPAAAPAAAGPIATGKYGCIETIPRLRNGSYEFEFEPRGAVQIGPGGQYTDPFGNEGTYRWDDAAQALWFSAGALDGGSATPMEDEPGRIRVVIPAGERERRWTCSLT